MLAQIAATTGLGGYEVIDPDAKPYWVGLAVDGEGTIFVAYLADLRDGSSGLFLRAREGTSWGERIEITSAPHFPGINNYDPFDFRWETRLASIAVVGLEKGVLVTYGIDEGELRAWWREDDGSHTSQLRMPILSGDSEHCWVDSPLHAAPGPDGIVTVGFQCWGNWERSPIAFQFAPAADTWTMMPVLTHGVGLLPLGQRNAFPLFGGYFWGEQDDNRVAPGLVWREGRTWRKTSLGVWRDTDIVSFSATATDSYALLAYISLYKGSNPSVPKLTFNVSRYRF